MSCENDRFFFQTPGAVARHRGECRGFLTRWKQVAMQTVAEGTTAVRATSPMLVAMIADTRNLRLAWDHLRRHGGPAPGLSGITYAELHKEAMWELLRSLSRDLKSGMYTPGGERKVKYPKVASHGYRQLWLAEIQDRVVQRAIVQIIGPLLHPFFSEHSFCRPCRDGSPSGRLAALAHADYYVAAQQRTTWIVEDIRDAFDQVPIERLLDVLRMQLPATSLLDLIRTVLGNRSHGVRQGSPLSPLLLDVFLNHFLERPWRQRYPEVPMLRFVDDLLVMCGPDDHPVEIYKALTDITSRAAMPLKGTGVAPVTNESVRWLGYSISHRHGNLVATMPSPRQPPTIQERLHLKLVDAHGKPNSTERADATIRGFIRQFGPCLQHSNVKQVVKSIKSIACEVGFEEVPALDNLSEMWHASFSSWCKVKSRVHETLARRDSGG